MQYELLESNFQSSDVMRQVNCNSLMITKCEFFLESQLIEVQEISIASSMVDDMCTTQLNEWLA